MPRSSLVIAFLLCASLPLVRPVVAQPSEAVRLGDVVVTGTRTEKRRDESPVRTEVVDRAEIQATGAQTLKDALANVPGLLLHEIHGKSGFHLSLQGMSSDQVLVLIDGLPISASTGSSVDLGRYLLSDVARIEVVKGAASAQYPTAELANAAGLGATAHLLGANADKGRLIRSGEGNSYARFHLARIAYQDASNARSPQTWTFEFEVQPAAQ